MRIEGHIIGFDEYMNLVLDEAEESHGRLNFGPRLAALPVS
eukprot:gene5291-450_t